MHKGYVKVWRKIEESFFYKDSAYVHLWVHLLIKANHRKHKFMFNGQQMTCDRGQLITGRNKLSEQTGIEPSKVNRILKTLKSEHQIEQITYSRFSLINILKYEDYQGDIEQVNEQQVNSKRTASEHKQELKRMKKNEKEVDLPQKSTSASSLSDSKDFLGKEKDNQKALNNLVSGLIKPVRA
jgi:hypothetical protein